MENEVDFNMQLKLLMEGTVSLEKELDSIENEKALIILSLNDYNMDEDEKIVVLDRIESITNVIIKMTLGV